MKEFFIEHFDAILGFIGTIIVGSGILKFVYDKKIHIENTKTDAKKVILDEKIHAIKEVITFERSGLEYEILEYSHPEFDLHPSPIEKMLELNDGIYYYSFFESRHSLAIFYNRLCDIRSKYEKYLSLDSAALLWVAEKYYIDLCKLSDALLSKDDSEDHLFLQGLLYSKDYEVWQKRLDGLLTKELENINDSIVTHSGDDWLEAKRKAYNLYEGSLLKKSLNDAPEFFNNYY